MPDPVCIKCGYLAGILPVIVTDTDNVTYNTGGNVIVNTTDISVTNDGLILNDPGKPSLMKLALFVHSINLGLDYSVSYHYY